VLRNFLDKLFCFFVRAEQFKSDSPPESLADKRYTPPQPIFCKFKKIFYVFCNFFTGRIIKIPLIFTVKVILIPCVIILIVAYSFQEMPKVEISNLKFFEATFTNAIKVKRNIFVADVHQCLCEDFPEFLTRGIKFFSPISAHGETITYQKAEQQCYEREYRTGKDLNCDSFHYADIIVFFLLGYLSALVIKIILSFFFDTQRLCSPASVERQRNTGLSEAKCYAVLLNF